WESGVQAQPWGWSAEMRIPYHCLRFTEKETATWGIDFARLINRKVEGMRWAYTPLEDGGFISNFGHLTNLTGIVPARHAEILPYVVSNVQTEPVSRGNIDGRDFVANTGFDAKYALSSNLMLDATINPDFGQVELDQPVLNLSTYETWFSEKRPFFLEGANLFDTPFSLFYSRRIGRQPGSVDDDELEWYTDYPNNTTILGAGKLSGKLGSSTSISILTAFTESESADYAILRNLVTDTSLVNGQEVIDTLNHDTLSRTGVAEERANYSIFRIKQDLLKNSSLGGMLTMASQKNRNPEVTGGVDWRLYTNSGVWMTSGQVVFSRSDIDETGFGLTASFEKASGKHVRGSLGVTIKNPHLRINRLGYTGRANTKQYYAWVQYRTNDDFWIVRNTYNNFNVYSAWNYDGVRYNHGGNYNVYMEFINNWSLSGGGSVQGERYSDRETRDNGLWEWPVRPTFSWWMSMNTDRRKKVSLNINPGGGQDRGGAWWAYYMGVTYRPKSNMEFEFGSNYTRTRNATRWVDNDDDQSVFADLNKDGISLHASASVMFNRDLSLQLSAQGLISGLDYDNYRYYEGHNQYSGQLEDRDNDYSYAALNSTMLLRWEYRPGSTLYLVWTRARSGADGNLSDLDLSRDMKRLFSGGAQNVFLVKTSYWLNI
ncbi:MAG: DUF5916 domain-containing protein, partial [candidate division Zixibacteria bacterium]